MRRSLLLLKPGKRAAVRIVCFPYAGGSASSFRAWSEHLPAHMELLTAQYPGRDSRFGEPLLRTVQAIVNDLIEDVVRYTDLPLIFFGYSLGALIAYEICVKLLQHGQRPPAELVVAAARAPHLARKITITSTLPDAEFLAKLRKFGGTPESILQDEDVMQHFLPILRADFACAEYYSPSQFPPLPCPITALAGNSDSTVEELDVAAWKLHTSSTFTMHTLVGGHFFLHEQLGSVISIVKQLAEPHVDHEFTKRARSH